MDISKTCLLNQKYPSVLFSHPGERKESKTNVRETQKAQTFDPKLKLTAAKDVTITTWAMNSSLQLHWANYSRGRMT